MIVNQAWEDAANPDEGKKTFGGLSRIKYDLCSDNSGDSSTVAVIWPEPTPMQWVWMSNTACLKSR
ncbi:MAG: hypothetical protein PVH61_24235 [Candidatus Aminicenantes bacterium]